MSEYWEQVYQRGLQSIGIWQTFAPAFTVGELTLAGFTAEVNALPGKANDREVQQDAADDARIARKGNFDLMEDLAIRFPRLLEGVLPPDDPWHAEIQDVRDIPTNSNDRRAQRARRVVSLWMRVNAQRAAAGPPLAPLLVGTRAVADLQATLDSLAALLQAVETEDGKLTEKREALKAQAAKVDKNNKRWFAAWEGNFTPGSPERNALGQIDTGPQTPEPTPLQIQSVAHQGNGDLRLTYVAGGGAHATTLVLQWMVQGVEPDFGHDTAVVQPEQLVPTGAGPGQTLRLRVRATNSTGTAYGNEALITV